MGWHREKTSILRVALCRTYRSIVVGDTTGLSLKAENSPATYLSDSGSEASRGSIVAKCVQRHQNTTGFFAGTTACTMMRHTLLRATKVTPVENNAHPL